MTETSVTGEHRTCNCFESETGKKQPPCLRGSLLFSSSVRRGATPLTERRWHAQHLELDSRLPQAACVRSPCARHHLQVPLRAGSTCFMSMADLTMALLMDEIPLLKAPLENIKRAWPPRVVPKAFHPRRTALPPPVAALSPGCCSAPAAVSPMLPSTWRQHWRGTARCPGGVASAYSRRKLHSRSRLVIDPTATRASGWP